MNIENIRNEFPGMPNEIRGMIAQTVAQQVQTSEQSRSVKRNTFRRTAILAFAAALVLGVTALAAYQLGLGDLALPGARDDGMTDISVVGWRDTPEYQAQIAWSDFQREYDETHDPAPDVKNDGSVPVEYLRLGAYNEEMRDALDGIMTTYDLKLHDSETILLPAEGSGVDLDAILLGDVQGAGGYAYRDGTMMLEVMQTLSGGETAEYQLFSAVKGTFTVISGSVDSGAEEWTYTAADGTEVNLLLGQYSAMLVADLENTFVTVNPVFRSVSERAALEELADSISWKTLDECPHFTQGYYETYRAALDEREAEYRLTDAARQELGADWTLTSDIYAAYYPEDHGRGSADSGDGSAWMEWTYTRLEGEGSIVLRYERPAGDIAEAFDTALADAGMEDAALVLKDVPVYTRTEAKDGVSYDTEYCAFTVYIQNAADGSAKALWLDEDKDLIFTLTADPGELTGDEFTAQIEHLLTGREPYPMAVEPEVVWTRLGHYEPTWLPEGWYSDTGDMATAYAMTLDGVWSGRISQAYVDGSVGHVIWFSYENAPEGATPRSILEAEQPVSEEELESAGITLTDTEVNGHPALLREAYRSAELTWIDEAAGVFFTVSGDDAETVRDIAESIAVR